MAKDSEILVISSCTHLERGTVQTSFPCFDIECYEPASWPREQNPPANAVEMLSLMFLVIKTKHNSGHKDQLYKRQPLFFPSRQHILHCFLTFYCCKYFTDISISCSINGNMTTQQCIQCSKLFIITFANNVTDIHSIHNKSMFILNSVCQCWWCFLLSNHWGVCSGH